MDDGVKQRIVGAFVLLALLVIFLPVFFDRERIDPVDRESQIPLAPELEEAVVDIQEIEMDLTKKPASVAVKPTPTPRKVAKQTVQATPKPKPVKPVVKAPEPKPVAPAKVEPKTVAVAAAKTLPTMPPNNSAPAKTMFTPKEDMPQPDAVVKPSLDKNGVPQSWVLQVGSFRFEGHAKQMRDDLVNMGYRSFVRDIETANGKMTRVYVGPKLDKTRLLEAQKAVEDKYKLKGLLVKFEP